MLTISISFNLFQEMSLQAEKQVKILITFWLKFDDITLMLFFTILSSIFYVCILMLPLAMHLSLQSFIEIEYDVNG